MEIIEATPQVNFSSNKYHHQIDKSNNITYPMSEDYHQQNSNSAGIFGFSNNGIFERPVAGDQQIRRDKLRIQGYEHNPPPPLIDEESGSGLNPAVYETAGTLSEMFNFPPQAGGESSQFLDQYRARQPPPPSAGDDWYAKTNPHQLSNTAAMQLFLMNPNPRSPPPSPPSAVAAGNNPSTLHMFPSNSSNQGFNFGPEINWSNSTNNNNPNPNSQMGGGTLMEGRGLSLSLSSTLQQMEFSGAKSEELMFSNNYGQNHHNQFRINNFHQSGQVISTQQQQQIGYGSSLGMVNVLRNSKYVKAAQELLEEFCSVGRGPFKKKSLLRQNTINPNGDNGDSTSSGKDPPVNLTASDRIEHQRRKVKLLSMLDEVDRRYNHYCEQMQMVVNSFDLVMGFGAAAPYTALAQKAMSRHFRCLKEAITAQLKNSCELLGEKDGGAGTSGLTKGETPRLKALEQSLRQQRAFHQMGMMEQEAWRPQRGLPERSVNILRAWLFEHFLHPYPSDADKHLLARQTGLSRNQVSNWFINARVRLWKPMVEEMYQQEAKDEDDDDDQSEDARSQNNNTQTPTPSTTTTTTTTTPTTTNNTIENDPSSSLIRSQQHFFENQVIPMSTAALPPMMVPESSFVDDACRRGSMVADHHHYGTTGSDIGSSTLISFGPTTVAGDVSLTLGLRHAGGGGGGGNMPEKGSSFSLRDFGGC
ncbi:hypothetical protein ACFE04_022098 [Oxalis oulophora]